MSAHIFKSLNKPPKDSSPLGKKMSKWNRWQPRWLMLHYKYKNLYSRARPIYVNYYFIAVKNGDQSNGSCIENGNTSHGNLTHRSISSPAGRNTQVFSFLAGKCIQYVQGHMHRTVSILVIRWVIWDWISSGKGRNWTRNPTSWQGSGH